MTRRSAGAESELTREGREVVDSIRRIVQLLRVSSREAERTVGLTAAQLFVLQRLRRDNALSLNDLAARTLTHQSSVSVVAQRLSERGLIRRIRSKVDARRVELSLTEAGERLIALTPHAAQEHLLTAVGNLKPGVRRQLAKLLGQLVHGMGLAAEMPTMFFEETAERKRRATPSKRAKASASKSRMARQSGGKRRA